MPPDLLLGLHSKKYWVPKHQKWWQLFSPPNLVFWLSWSYRTPGVLKHHHHVGVMKHHMPSWCFGTLGGGVTERQGVVHNTNLPERHIWCRKKLPPF